MESSTTNMSKKSDDIQTENILEDEQGAVGQPERSKGDGSYDEKSRNNDKHCEYKG